MQPNATNEVRKKQNKTIAVRSRQAVTVGLTCAARNRKAASRAPPPWGDVEGCGGSRWGAAHACMRGRRNIKL